MDCQISRLIDKLNIDIMKSFRQFFSEMARTAKVAPSILSPEINSRLQKLIGVINEKIKYGNYKYPDLIDSNGEPAVGLDQNTLQHRKLTYLYLYLTNPHGEGEISDRLKESIGEMKDYLKENGLSANDTMRRLNLAIIHKIKDNPEWFLSRDFESVLLNPTNLADFMNSTRVTSNSQSRVAASNREKAYGLSIKDTDAINAATRDSNTFYNRQTSYDSKRKRPNLTRQ